MLLQLLLLEKRERLLELLEKEAELKYNAALMRERREFVPVSLEELPKEENDEKEQLLFSGFLDWNRNEFAAFLRACEKFSRSEFEKIADVVESDLVHRDEDSRAGKDVQRGFLAALQRAA